MLYKLLFGKSKKKMSVIMIDTEKACENYQKAREASKGSKASQGWHKIEPAPPDSKTYKKQNSKSKMWKAYNK